MIRGYMCIPLKRIYDQILSLQLRCASPMQIIPAAIA